MKIEEAIKIFKSTLQEPSNFYSEDFRKALRLGIEAWHFKQAWQKGQYFPPDYLLPGETK